MLLDSLNGDGKLQAIFNAILSIFYYLLIPLACYTACGVCIYLFVSAAKKNKAVPNTYSDGQITTRLVFMIVTSVLALFCNGIYTFFLLQIAIVIASCVSIYLYVSAKIKNKKEPDTYSRATLRGRLIFMIISCASTVTIIAIVIGFIWLLTSAIAYM